MKTINNYGGLEYVFVTLRRGSISIKDALKIDQKIAQAIIKHMPLRGKELLFLRKQLKLSCAKLSVELQGAFDASTLFKWEKKKNDRLSPSTEMFIRVFFAEKFNIEIRANSKELIPDSVESKLEYAA